MPTDFGGRGVRVPRFARRDVLKRIAATGAAAAVPAFPVFAEEAAKASNTLAETLAHYATDLKYEDLPEDVVRLAKRTILDTIGCAYGGYAAGPSRIATKLAGDVSAK